MAARRKQAGALDLESSRPPDDEQNDEDRKYHLPLWLRRFLDHTKSQNLVYIVFPLLLISIVGLSSVGAGRKPRSWPEGYAVAEPERCGTDDERVQNVIRWAIDNGAWIHPNVSTGMFEVPGKKGLKIRGVLATGEVAEKEKIFIVPKNLLLNIEKLKTHHWLGPVYAETPQLHDSIGGLTVLLLAEALNVTSAIRPYLCSLPTLVPLPVFYAPGKLERVKAQLAPGESAIMDGLVEARRDVIQLHRPPRCVVRAGRVTGAEEEQYMKVMPTLFLKYPHLFSPEAFSYQRWAWAVSLIMSRTWGRQISDPILNKKTGGNTSMAHTMAPAADMPNHDASGYEAMQDKEGRLVLLADRNVSGGEQIYISYGAKCNAEFLAHYGFVPGYPSVKACKNNATLSASHQDSNVTKWRRGWRQKFQTFLTIVNDQRFRNSKAYLAMQSSASNPGMPHHLAAADAGPAKVNSVAL